MWCRAKHIFIRCPGTGSHSVWFLFVSIPYVEHSHSDSNMSCVQHEVCGSIQKVMTFCELFYGVSHPCMVILWWLPSRSLDLPLFVPLFGCTFIC